VYTSNVFAILGCGRCTFCWPACGPADVYQVWAGGGALFVGAKMLVEKWVHISVLASLGIVVGILAIATAISLFAKPKQIT